MISSCNHTTTNRLVSVSEKRRIFKINNPSSLTVNQVNVDNCYIKHGLRCDFLFEIINGGICIKVFYVELKGTDILHAFNQLKTTLAYCHSIHQSISRECHIVASGYPSALPSSQVLKKKFFTETKIQLSIKNTLQEVQI